MRVVVVGTGYVGLVTGVCLSAKGHDVTCVDVNADIVDKLNKGQPTIFENGLPDMLSKVCASGGFRASLNLRESLRAADIVLIAVGTPSKDGVIDLQYVKRAAREIGEYIRDSDVYLSVVVKSTVVPGTTDTVVREEIEAASGKRLGDFGLGMNPEFLREGDAIEDFVNPDRIILGFEDAQTLTRLRELYKPWGADKLEVNTRTAELIKYANNCLLATQISAMNEIANVAAAIGGIDVLDVVKGVSLDKRWSPIIADGSRVEPGILTYLLPGCGFGGSCFPKDVQALRSEGRRLGLPMQMLNAVLSINENQAAQVAEILKRTEGDLRDKRVLLLGLAFKPDTDDVRESASLIIADTLLDAGAVLVAHDPIARDNFVRSFGERSSQVRFVNDFNSEIVSADIIVVATRWAEYLVLGDLDLRGKTVFDARRLLSKDSLQCSRYLTIGYRNDDFV